MLPVEKCINLRDREDRTKGHKKEQIYN